MGGRSAGAEAPASLLAMPTLGTRAWSWLRSRAGTSLFPKCKGEDADWHPLGRSRAWPCLLQAPGSLTPPSLTAVQPGREHPPSSARNMLQGGRYASKMVGSASRGRMSFLLSLWRAVLPERV